VIEGARQNVRVIPSEARDATEPIPLAPDQDPSVGSKVRALARGWRAPQNRDGMALVLSSAVSSAVGLLYWVVAARMFDPATVGVNSTLVSTLGLLGILAQLNLGSAMLRFVPIAGGGARALVAVCYATGVVAALLIGSVFALGAAWWAPELRAAVGAGALLAYFVLSTPFWTVFNMQDYLLTGIKRATVVPVENLAFALLKIGLLVVGGLFGFYGAIAGSWALGTAVTVVAITIYLVRVLPPREPRQRGVPAAVTLRSISGFVAADWFGSMCLTIVNFGLPLLVFSRLGADAAATFGVTWQLAYALYLVPTGMGQSLVAHAAADPSELGAAHRQMLTKSLTLVVPAVVVLAAGSWLILIVLFGAHYASTGSMLLALAALSAVPACVNLAGVAAARVSQRRVGQFGITLALAVIVIPAVWVLMPLWGLTGVGVALVGGQTVVAVGVLLLTRFARGAARPAGPA
jgi:O-antigen/teichoic acid export membrane protein